VVYGLRGFMETRNQEFFDNVLKNYISNGEHETNITEILGASWNKSFSAVEQLEIMARINSKLESIIPITKEGPPTIAKIIECLQYKMQMIKRVKKIQAIDAENNDPSSAEYKYLQQILAIEDGKPETFAVLNRTFRVKDDVIPKDLEFIKQVAGLKLNEIYAGIKNKNSAMLSEAVNKIFLPKSIERNFDKKKEKLIEKNDAIGVKLRDQKSTLEDTHTKLLYSIKTATKEYKPDLQKREKEARAQLELIDTLKEQCEKITYRLNKRMQYAQEHIENRLHLPVIRHLMQRLPSDYELKFGNIDGYISIPTNTIIYKVDGGNVVCSFSEATTLKVGDESKQIHLTFPIKDITGFDTANPGSADNEQRIKYHLNEDNFTLEQHKELKSLNLVLDELDEDFSRLDKCLDYFDKVAANPSAFSSEKDANVIIQVLSLSDTQSFDAQGIPYFKDEIGRDNEVYSDDWRTRHGLEGEVVYRGASLEKNEFKRSTLMNTGNGGSTVVIETRVIDPKGSNPIIRVVDCSKYASRDNEAKNLAAIKFAKELLLQYKESKDGYIHIRGGANDIEQASKVYAALLMLTSADDNEAKVKLSPRHIKIHVEGYQKPKYFGLRQKDREAFIKEQLSTGIKDDINKEVRNDTAAMSERLDAIKARGKLKQGDELSTNDSDLKNRARH
jgi:hypothetical protein